MPALPGPFPDPPPALLETLRPLLADPQLDRLFGRGRQPGLFPSASQKARQSVQDLLSFGLVTIDDPSLGPSTRVAMTERGREMLLDHGLPRELLEDLLRSMEQQRESLQAWENHLAQQHELLHRQCDDVSRLLRRMDSSRPADSGSNFDLDPTDRQYFDFLKKSLQAGQREGPPTLAELYDLLQNRISNLTIGQFHDAIRAWQQAQWLTLAPWTGHLMSMPHPELALLIGHEVLYYVHFHTRPQLDASLANGAAAAQTAR